MISYHIYFIIYIISHILFIVNSGDAIHPPPKEVGVFLLKMIKWAFLYGVVLCVARAMGEFGAVSVLSGHLRGKTNTLPLHVEILYNEFQYVPAFAVSSILVILAVILLIARNVLEHKGKGEKGDVR